MDVNQEAKTFAAIKAVSYIENGMKVGLGTGSTAKIAIDIIGQRVAEGLKIVGIPTSERSHRQALDLSIPLTTFEETPHLDVTIDGADQVQVQTLAIIKGLGGALVREKIVAFASSRYLIVIDDSKVVQKLGNKVPVPVEVVQFGWSATVAHLKKLTGDIKMRKAENADGFYVTDGGNYIADCFFSDIADPKSMESSIKNIVGVVDCGLFLGLDPIVIIGSASGARLL
ncbi:MAG: ribose-5-phosphate isomerase RpiA [Candidatus Obscuribacterales bacterium]|nr:ribose-5-phosphate isomerase RpiA [Candidatus Obscuribacterales bacterium]